MKTPVTVKLEKIGSRFILLTVENNNKEIFHDFLHTNITYRLEKEVGRPFLFDNRIDLGKEDGDDINSYEDSEKRNIAFNNFVKLLKQYREQYPSKIILHYL